MQKHSETNLKNSQGQSKVIIWNIGSTWVPDAVYQVSKSSASWFRRKRFLKFFTIIYMGMVMWPGTLEWIFIPHISWTRAVNFQIDLRGGQWKTIWFTSGGQFECFLSSVFVGSSKVTGKIILDLTHILKFGEWHAISFLCMHVHTKRYWKVLSRVVAINFVQNAQWRNRK